MKAIKKLNIVLRIAILVMIIPFFYLLFKSNIAWGVTFITIILIFILIRLLIFKKKYWGWDLEEGYTWIPLYYLFGGIFILIAVMASFGTISDLKQGAPIPIWGISILSGAWILGFLLIYYAYKSKRESILIPKKKGKTKNIVTDEKTKNLWIYYLMAFMVVSSIIRYIFNVSKFSLINVIVTISFIIFMYLLLKITTSKNKHKVLFVILIFLFFFLGPLVYSLLTLPKLPSDRCVSKGLYPKDGIPGLQYCEQDSDCIKVIERDSCCDACYGGNSNAINKKHIDFWECVRLKDKDCSNTKCSENITFQSCFAKARCVNNICELD